MENHSKYRKVLDECNETETLLKQIKNLSIEKTLSFSEMSDEEKLRNFNSVSEYQEKIISYMFHVNYNLKAFLHDIEEEFLEKMAINSVSSKDISDNSERYTVLHQKHTKIEQQKPAQDNEATKKKKKKFVKKQTMPLKEWMSSSEPSETNLLVNNKSCRDNKLEKNKIKEISIPPKIIAKELYVDRKMYNFDMSLLKDCYCMISHIEDPGHFYVHEVSAEVENNLTTLELELKELYSRNRSDFSSKEEAINSGLDFYVCYDKDWDQFFRCKVLDWNYSKIYMNVFYVDYGITKLCKSEHLRVLDENLYNIPILAYRCHLAFLYPPGSTETNILTKWPKESIKTFIKITKSFFDKDVPVLHLEVVSCQEESNAVDLMDTNGASTVGQLLIDAGLCVEIVPRCDDRSSIIAKIDSTNQNDEDDDENYSTNESEKEEFDEIDDNVNVAVTGYDPQDEKLACRFTRSDGTCFKGTTCRRMHHILRQDGYTTDKESIYTNAFNELILPNANDMVQVMVTHIVDVKQLYVQLQNQPSCTDYCDMNLNELQCRINDPKTLKSFKKHKITPGIGQIVLAYHWTKQWYRGQVKLLTSTKAEIFFVDYGEVFEVKLKYLRDIPQEFLYLPFQAVLCHLYDIERKETVPSKQAVEYLEKICLSRTFNAKIIGKSYDCLYVNLRYNTGEDLSQKIINAGFATKDKKVLLLKESEKILVD